MRLRKTAVSIKVSDDCSDISYRVEELKDKLVEVTIELGKQGFAVDPEYKLRWSGNSTGSFCNLVLVHDVNITDSLRDFLNLDMTTRCF